MKYCNQCLVTKPISDFYKNRSKQDGLSDQCKECCKSNTTRHRTKNPEHTRELVRTARAANKDSYNERRRGAAGVIHRIKHADALTKSFRRYRQENKAKLAAYRASRRASQLNATPVWADKALIAVIYKQAKAESKTSGIIFEVDHIVPLSNFLVCGLHCEDNLQIIPRSENRRKSNKFWPDMPANTL